MSLVAGRVPRRLRQPFGAEAAHDLPPIKSELDERAGRRPITSAGRYVLLPPSRSTSSRCCSAAPRPSSLFARAFSILVRVDCGMLLSAPRRRHPSPVSVIARDHPIRGSAAR